MTSREQYRRFAKLIQLSRLIIVVYVTDRAMVVAVNIQASAYFLKDGRVTFDRRSNNLAWQAGVGSSKKVLTIEKVSSPIEQHEPHLARLAGDERKACTAGQGLLTRPFDLYH